MPVGFTHETTVSVRFRDLDPMGWVHNAVALVYAEEARIDYFETVVGVDIGAIEGAIAHQSVDYEVPIRLDDAVTVHYRVSAIGETSLTSEFVIETDTRVASGEVVHVVLDGGNPRSVPDEWRDRILAFETGNVETVSDRSA